MTLTSQILSASQFKQLSDAYDVANAQMSVDPHQLGIWVPVYNLLYGFLTAQVLGVDTPRTDVSVDPQTWL